MMRRDIQVLIGSLMQSAAIVLAAEWFGWQGGWVTALVVLGLGLVVGVKNER